jgi:hypothetical protein
MTFEIKEAKRLGARLLIQLSGVSGSGKTYSALHLAYGLTGGDSSKIIGIDTENRRMSLYADCLPNKEPFRVLEFFAPFSPARYVEAIKACCDAGAEVIVIDSVSHEWESEGGCEWIANNSSGRLADWKTAKREHKRFMTFMLQCPAHIIACTRAREKTDFSDTKNPVSLGIQPIQEKNFSFEATVSLLMHEQGKSQDVLKCPAELQKILGRGQGYITVDDGMALRHWVDGGGVVDQEVERARGLFLNAAEQGLEILRKTYQEVPQSIRDTLGQSFMDSVVASARAFDEGRAQVTDPSINDLNRQIASQQINDTTESAATLTGNTGAPQSRGNDSARSERDAREINGGVCSGVSANDSTSALNPVSDEVPEAFQKDPNHNLSIPESVFTLTTVAADPLTTVAANPLTASGPLKLRDKQQLIRTVNGLPKEKTDKLTTALIAKFGFDNQTQMSIQLTHQNHADFIHAFIKGQ